ncbi:MAG TPA: HAD family hydrolase [Anaerolineales bacterium]|nr:HAD family hydrolase [Anaerolineales bacterium]
MRSLPYFLFLDLDDTILDYMAPGERCWENLCASFAPRLDNISPDQLLTAIKQTGKWFWSDPERHRTWRLDLRTARRLVLAQAFSQLQVNDLKTSKELADSFTTLREEMVQPFPGSVETLKILQDRDIRMGLITNGNAEFQRAKIRRFALEQYFNFILVESEFGVGKPDPRVFKHGLERFGVSPTQVWMIGDDLEYDIRPAQQLGMGTVWVNHADESLPADGSIKPTHTIYSLADLIEEP